MRELLKFRKVYVLIRCGRYNRINSFPHLIVQIQVLLKDRMKADNLNIEFYYDLDCYRAKIRLCAQVVVRSLNVFRPRHVGRDDVVEDRLQLGKALLRRHRVDAGDSDTLIGKCRQVKIGYEYVDRAL